jgi:hypothetical protein
MIRPTLKFIADSKAPELIRFTNQSGTYWALVGQRGNEMMMLLVFQAEGPRCENIMGPMNILIRPFENTPVLSYGIDYSIQVDHAGECQVGDAGALINQPGAYIIAKDTEYVCCKDARRQNQPSFFEVKTGIVRSEPESQRAAFAQWELALSGEPLVRLLQLNATKKP